MYCFLEREARSQKGVNGLLSVGVEIGLFNMPIGTGVARQSRRLRRVLTANEGLEVS